MIEKNSLSAWPEITNRWEIEERRGQLRMKSFNSILLCLVYGIVLVLGGVIFKYLEYYETETVEVTEPPEWTHLKALALRDNPPANKDELLSLLTPWLPRACPALPQTTVRALVTRGSQEEAVYEVEVLCPHLHKENVTVVVVYPWSFFDALFFSMTVTTTIGYGHLYPTLPWGRIVCILYSLVGIPLTGILLAMTSNFFGDKLLQLFKSRLSDERQQSSSFIAGATAIYVALGFLVFIFLPSVLLSYLEGWTYVDAVYYSYITLTTIGFGDMVPANGYEGIAKDIYQICLILWIMIGLGYWVMVANFITKALNSKQLTASVKRSAEEMKKLMEQVGLKHHDPAFLRLHSKASLNLMLQLGNILAVQEAENGEAGGMRDDLTDTTSAGPSSPTSPVSPSGIPGISALFGAGLSRTPISHLMGPLKKEYNTNTSSTESISRRPTFESSVSLCDETSLHHTDEKENGEDYKENGRL